MTEPTKYPALAPTPERRDITIEALSSLFAAGRIELEDFEARVDRAVRAATLAELEALVADLQPGAGASKTPVPAPMGPDRPKSSRLTIAVLSGMQRKGRWFPARRHRAVAFMGGGRLDFREAELQAGTTDVYVYAVWGGMQVIVPPDLDLEVDGWAIAGGLNEISSHPGPLEAQRQRLRIHARVLMGGVEVKVRERKGEEPPNELLQQRKARKRLR